MNDKLPSIRFKEFTDDWEQRKLDEILIQRVEHQTISDDAPLLAFSYAEGVINPEDKKTNKRDFIMTDKFSKIFSRTEFNDIIYNPANVIHGAIHRNKLGTGVVSPIYKIFICNGVSPKYMGERLHTEKFIQEITKYIEGTVIKLRTLSPEKFLEMMVEVPNSYEEQEKIGEYFEKLDQLITLHQRKYDQLLNIKKSMLEKMFPKNGKKAPEIRFDGFTDDWEQRKFGDGMDLLTGYPFESEKFSDNGINLIRGMNVKRGYLDLSNSLCMKWKSSEGLEKYLLENEDILIQMDGALIGKSYAKIKETQLPALLVQRVTRARAIPEKSNSDFMYQTIQRDFLKYIILNKTDSAVPHLSLNDIREFPIRVPNLEEQKKIGEYFSNLDNLITLHQRKLEKLQNLKISMLKQMFL